MKFRRKKFGKRFKRVLLLFTEVFVIMFFIWLMALLFGVTVQAGGPGYRTIDQTVNSEVVEMTEAVAEIYLICPELLQAIIFFESGNQRTVTSRWGDVGYMQVNPRWQQDRMDRLGVKDLKDGYSNIIVGTDLLCELFAEYEDPALVLMSYNEGVEKAVWMYNMGLISEYALNVLELSEQLERLHGK